MVVHMRHTRGHTANRRSHHALKVARFETCKDCQAKHLMHRACPNCGKYRGRVVVDVLKKTNKKLAKSAPVATKKTEKEKKEVAPKAKAAPKPKKAKEEKAK